MKITLFLLMFLLFGCSNQTIQTNQNTTVNDIQENLSTPGNNNITQEKSNSSGETISKEKEEVIFHNLNSQDIANLKASSQENFVENNTFSQNNTGFEISPEKDISTSDFIESYEIKGQANFGNK